MMVCLHGYAGLPQADAAAGHAFRKRSGRSKCVSEVNQQRGGDDAGERVIESHGGSP